MTSPKPKAGTAKAKTPTSKAKNKGGRPPKIIADEKTIAVLKALAAVGATQLEAAMHLKVSETTFEGFLGKNKEAREAWDAGPPTFKLSLRRAQMKLALSGHATMLIWLGKQYLGQRDKSDVELAGKDGNPIQSEFTVKFVAATPSVAAAA